MFIEGWHTWVFSVSWRIVDSSPSVCIFTSSSAKMRSHVTHWLLSEFEFQAPVHSYTGLKLGHRCACRYPGTSGDRPSVRGVVISAADKVDGFSCVSLNRRRFFKMTKDISRILWRLLPWIQLGNICKCMGPLITPSIQVVIYRSDVYQVCLGKSLSKAQTCWASICVNRINISTMPNSQIKCCLKLEISLIIWRMPYVFMSNSQHWFMKRIVACLVPIILSAPGTTLLIYPNPSVYFKILWMKPSRFGENVIEYYPMVVCKWQVSTGVDDGFGSVWRQIIIHAICNPFPWHINCLLSIKN